MKIAKLSIENFKKFKDRFEFDFVSQNFLVGENNTGKTSVIEALGYLLNGPQKDKKYKNLNATNDEHIIVEALIVGNFDDIDQKYQKYIYEEDGVLCIKIKRSNEQGTTFNGGNNREIELNESKILCWNNDEQRYENPTGKDTTFNLIDVVPIYANDHVENIVSFDSTKILGKLIKSSVGDFFETDAYRDFKSQHDTVFNTGPNSLKSRLDSLSQEISGVLREQWGELELDFKFDLTDNSNHLKKGSVLIREDEVEHELGDKGSGLQRSVMLSMIQVLSKVRDLEVGNNLILCIDEPELNLHPTAQVKLAEALRQLSENIQIIVSAHSPYILKSFRKDSDSVYVFRHHRFANPNKLETMSILPFGPTLAEIQFFAYNLTPSDLHNELYGYLEAEDALNFQNTKTWIRENADGTTRQEFISLQKYIRHSIHHPENTRNAEPTEAEMQQSITEMINSIQLII